VDLLAGEIAVGTGTVLGLITLIALPIAATAFARSGPAWRSIGKGPLAIDEDLPRQRPAQPPPVDRALQRAEARQMLEAKSYHRQRRGESPLDVDAEVARLLEGPQGSPSPDEELRDEVRRLIVARNERRLRRGQPALDVETETERQLADLVGSG
jgi:hypothetical protein